MTHKWFPGKWSFAKDFHTVQFTVDVEPPRVEHIVGSLIFQDGPIKDYGQNGTTNEEVILALIERLNGLNAPPYDCPENTRAIFHLTEALAWLERRTTNRQQEM